MQILGTGNQRASKASRIQANGVLLTYASWDVSIEGEDAPTTNFQSYVNADAESYSEGLHGPLEAKLRFGGDWDAAANPVDKNAAPGLYPRDDLANLLFVTSRIDLIQWSFRYARIRQSHNSANVRGGGSGQNVAFDVSGMNQGSWTWPAGSSTS